MYAHANRSPNTPYLSMHTVFIVSSLEKSISVACTRTIGMVLGCNFKLYQLRHYLVPPCAALHCPVLSRTTPPCTVSHRPILSWTTPHCITHHATPLDTVLNCATPLNTALHQPTSTHPKSPCTTQHHTILPCTFLHHPTTPHPHTAPHHSTSFCIAQNCQALS